MRFCNRCKTPLLTKTGAPDFRRHFCSRECKNEDSKDRKAARRKNLPGKKCPLCGRKAVAEPFLSISVSPDTGIGSDLLLDPEVVTYDAEGFHVPGRE
jgi:hypothetical protein